MGILNAENSDYFFFFVQVKSINGWTEKRYFFFNFILLQRGKNVQLTDVIYKQIIRAIIVLSAKVLSVFRKD